MKTAVEIPDRLAAAADRLAKKKGLTRSALYSKALARYLADQNAVVITKRRRTAGMEDLLNIGSVVRHRQSSTATNGDLKAARVNPRSA